jgi:hypothetical protein
LALYEKKTAATLCKKETGSMEIMVDPQALCIFETFEQSFILGCPWMVIIWNDLNFAEA